VSIAYDESDAGSSGWPAVPIKPQCRPNSADSGLLPNDGFGANFTRSWIAQGGVRKAPIALKN